MVQSLKAKCYRAKMVRRVHIPKGEGKTRPLGIPAVSDKVLQSCAASVLSGFYEADFLPCSFGYRPHRGAKEAVMAVRDAHRFKPALTKRLEKFKLSLAEEKTGVHLFTRFRKRDSTRFDFLGFEYRWGKSMKGDDVVKLRTSPKRRQKSLAAFTAWVKERRNKRLRTLFWELNPKLRGYYQCFGVTGNRHSLERFHEEVMRTLYRRLNRRSQKRSFNWKGFAAVMSYYGMERPRITWGREDQTCMSLA